MLSNSEVLRAAISSQETLSYSGQYVRRSTRKVLAQRFHFAEDTIPELGASFNIAPPDLPPIVRLNRDNGKREIVPMRWA